MRSLENYKLFYEQIAAPKRKLKGVRRKPGRKPKQPIHTLDNLATAGTSK